MISSAVKIPLLGVSLFDRCYFKKGLTFVEENDT